MGDYTMEQERLRREREEAMRKAGKVVGEEIVEIGASTKEELKRCFVFASRNISKKNSMRCLRSSRHLTLAMSRRDTISTKI